MKKLFLASFILFAFSSIATAQQLKSPQGEFEMQFSLSNDGTPTYSLKYKNKEVVKTSKLGHELKHDKKSLLNAFTI